MSKFKPTVAVTDFFLHKDAGSHDTAIAESLYGFNSVPGNLNLEKNSDTQGKVFFTRPLLNLSEDNIRSSRTLQGMMGSASYSIPRWVKSTLDARTGVDQKGPDFGGGGKTVAAQKASLCNNQQGFIPMMTNAIKVVSGWPDKAVPTFVAAPNAKKVSYMQQDGKVSAAGPVDISCTFTNSMGEPLVSLLSVWAEYGGDEFAGVLFPYNDFISENELDYNIRIFRVITDRTGRYMTRISATLPGLLQLGGLGSAFDYDIAKPGANNADEITWQMKFPTIEYDDPILIFEFNAIVVIFKPNMMDGVREGSMTRVPFRFIKYFRSLVYYRINPDTLEFENWVDNSSWDIVANYYNSSGIVSQPLVKD